MISHHRLESAAAGRTTDKLAQFFWACFWVCRKHKRARRRVFTVALAEQNIQRVLADADQVAVLTAGRLAYCGPADQAAEQADLAKLLLS